MNQEHKFTQLLDQKISFEDSFKIIKLSKERAATLALEHLKPDTNEEITQVFLTKKILNLTYFKLETRN